MDTSSCYIIYNVFTPYCAILQYSTPDTFPVLYGEHSTVFLLILHLCTFICTRKFLRFDEKISCDRVEASIINLIPLHQPDPRNGISFSILNFIIRCIFHTSIYSFQFCALIYIVKAFPKIIELMKDTTVVKHFVKLSNGVLYSHISHLLVGFSFCCSTSFFYKYSGFQRRAHTCTCISHAFKNMFHVSP